MMRAAHTAMLGFAALALAGCGDPKRGQVLVHWTFAGQNCQQAGVHIIQLEVQGEVLTPNQFFCVDSQNNMRVEGADIGAYFFGTYTLTVTGLDVDGTSIIYQASQTFTVNASSIDVNVDLPRLPSTVATADLSWDALTSLGGFAPGANGAMTCAEAQVDTVRIFVDGTSIGDVACDTNTVEGAVISPLTAGNHTFSISGLRNGAGTPTLVYQTTTAVSAPFQIGATTNVDVTAASVGSGIGSATLNWGTGCSGTVTYTLKNPMGAPISGSAACAQAVSVSNVTAGLWLVDATAGAMQAHFGFGVPNQSTASWTINFGP
jgi:hypothetical protein